MKQYIIAALLMTYSAMSHATTEPVTIDPVKGGLNTTAKTEVKLDELPVGVKKTLDGAGFTGWKPQRVYLVRQDNIAVYEVNFVRGEEQELLKLNEQGGKIE